MDKIRTDIMIDRGSGLRVSSAWEFSAPHLWSWSLPDIQLVWFPGYDPSNDPSALDGRWIVIIL